MVGRRGLRCGLTTGSCATACASAAALWMLSGEKPRRMEISLPRARRTLAIDRYLRLADGAARTETTKDAGDDPDVTHGATVFVELRLRAARGFEFAAGAGVGTVCSAGLPLAPGEAAINPGPRRMIAGNLDAVAKSCGYSGGFHITVGICGGEQLARRTMNARIGIAGGLSVLGTTGIVRPFSCSAWVAAIRQGVSVACANGVHCLAATIGSRSEDFARRRYGLPDMALIEMGDMAGALLKAVRRQSGVRRLVLAGGFAKMSKLALGRPDLHSRAGGVDFARLARWCRGAGADARTADAVAAAPNAMAALQVADGAGIALADLVCARAREHAAAVLGDAVELHLWALDRSGRPLGSALP